ncbi:sodium-glucose/galactose cotransporter domain protein, partial [Vibrio harveyi]
IQP